MAMPCLNEVMQCSAGIRSDQVIHPYVVVSDSGMSLSDYRLVCETATSRDDSTVSDRQRQKQYLKE